MDSTRLNQPDADNERLRRALDQIRARRASGEAISDEAALAEFPDIAPRLAAELQRLAMVQQARRQAELLGPPVLDRAPLATQLSADAIPGYELRGEIHRGSQGVVYLATQRSTGREVAIKIMRHGPFADAFDRLRFEREVRVLAALKHPNIVSIYDSGVAAGHSFFVMDYIEGRPLDAYVERTGRNVTSVLRLLVKVCDAVTAAHIRGVIHRDLKPGNIRIDARGEPHVLDFGLAKLDPINVLNQVVPAGRDTPLADRQPPPDQFTQTGQFVGSLPWASPEQAEGIAANIDIRTDVYSLGVVLYQALTGQFPYAVTGALHRVLENIQTAPPAPPSQLRREINDEVETIVLKCLKKERSRRYQSAAELSQDIQRFLRGEPIDAKRDSRLYLFRKQFRRNRISVLATVSVFLSLIAGIIATSRATNRALHAEADAIALARAEARLREQAQWESYKASLTAADAAINANSTTMAKTRLEAAPQALRGWEWRYLNARLDQSLQTYPLPMSLSVAPVLTPDRSRMFTALINGEIRSIDPIEGDFRHFASIHPREITAMNISPDGTRLAVGTRDGWALVFDVASARELLSINAHPTGAVSAIAISSNCDTIATSGGRPGPPGGIRLWDAKTGEPRAVFDAPSTSVNHLAFHPAGRVLASAHTKSPAGVRLWNVENGHELQFIDYEGLDVFQVEFSPNGDTLAVASQDSGIRLFDSSGELRQTLAAHIAGVNHIVFSADGTRLVSASADQTIRVWDLITGTPSACLRGHLHPVSYAAFAGNEDRLISTAFNERSLKTWRTDTTNEPATFDTGKYFVLFVSFTPDGRELFTHQRRWSTATHELLGTLSPREGWDWNSWLNVDQEYEWMGSNPPAFNGALLRGGSSICLFDQPLVMRPVMSKDGRFMAIAPREQPLQIRRLSDAQLQSSILIEEVLTGADFTPDGSTLITWADGGRWAIFDTVSGRGKLRGNHGDQQIVNAAFSGDGRLFATASYDGAARICETASGVVRHVLRPTGSPPGDQSVVWSVAFSPDGSRLATGSKDRRLRLWDVETGAELIALGRHSGTVMCIAWSPDGTQIATGGFDGTVCLWDSLSRADRARIE